MDEISWFESLKKLRFRLELTHKNIRNSLNFWGMELMDFFSSLCVQEIIFRNIGSMINFYLFVFFVPPSKGGGVKKLDSSSSKIFVFDIQEKSRTFESLHMHSFRSNIWERSGLNRVKVVGISAKRLKLLTQLCGVGWVYAKMLTLGNGGRVGACSIHQSKLNEIIIELIY